MPFPLLALGPMIAGISGILDRVLPKKLTDGEKQQFELEMAKLDWQNVLGQLEINKQEAAHESIFVSGWRPFVGWVCGSALAWNFVIEPLLVFAGHVAGADILPIPTLDSATLMPVLMGMLGLGAYRTYEKVQDANKRR